MKIKNKLATALLAAGVFMSGCSEGFLDRPPLSQISADNFYQTKDDLRLATAALYGGKPWAEWNYNCYLPIGEVLSGNMALNYWGDAVQLHTFSVSGSNEIMIANWKAMYKIIAHCNVTIKAIQEKAPASIPEKDRNAAVAEAKFLRAFAYYNLALQWRDIPIIEDNTDLINSPLVFRNPVNDVYKFVVNDLLFAVDNLPAKDAAGRVTTWSAQGMLAKTYLTWAGLDAKGNGPRSQVLLDSARLYAGNVCKLSGLFLLPNYADLFKTQFNDNPESLFALQWAPGTGWLEGNMLQIYSPGGAEISAAGQAGWFQIAPTYDLYKQYAGGDSIRRKATMMLKGDYYAELNAAGGGYKFPGNAGLKKHIIGTRADNSAPTMSLTSSTEHNAMLRLAEVYLIYAEAVMGNNASTADADALLYFNKVRTRAGLAPVTSLNAETLFTERRVELAAEGHFWEDLVRLSYYNEAGAIKKLNEQERILFTYDNGVVTKGDPLAAVTPANSTTFKFPIPSPEVTANPKLLEAPVPYAF
ncbi:MAG: RagB/SusD family nutrient uptake outer membrane protein [Dyadobacter sp. 50-39]|uniref:RagB/SusD family nutrient uptake outer membrane protein n=1 Tax=Dyadobacter sp. 50-39 TaxID=1895756 RepID=UPI00095B0985|nr:RagB/SusD family nutrient uptake outer membrane protein [Dyadobacter sp. 50-39]OJV13059.1 MAG: RagB/SusD family nutrient uptake outer membrane protein [Dyadobacter sp. 50-39]